MQDGAVYSGVAIAVTVTLFADLRRLLPRGTHGPQRYTVREGATVSELLAAIGVEAGVDVTVAVNGELAARDTPLREGAEVMVLSPMEGGAAGAATLRGEIRRLDQKIDGVDQRLAQKIDGLRAEMVSEMRRFDSRIDGLDREVRTAIDIRERLAALEARRPA